MVYVEFFDEFVTKEENARINKAADTIRKAWIMKLDK